jgi:hypothetical protein
VPNLRTMVTEVGTGLGMLGAKSLDEVLASRSPVMHNLSPEDWDRLAAARSGGAFDAEFHAAWENGRAFLAARDGLRGRRPEVVEWKGGVRGSGDEVAPVDLRVDHVYLVSCKYLSNILFNASPAHVFDDLLTGGHGRKPGSSAGADWYAEVAPAQYLHLYGVVREAVGQAPGTEGSGAPRPSGRSARAPAPTLPGLEGAGGIPVPTGTGAGGRPTAELRDLPARPAELTTLQRGALGLWLRSGWPPGGKEAYGALADEVARVSAARWHGALAQRAGAGEAMLWRLLRMGNAPYFVLGSSPSRSLRLRIATPWDWRQHFTPVHFGVFAQEGGQPRVGWQASVRNRTTGELVEVAGHVEVRWSHGRFGGSPEAKGYLDTRHHLVPGYFPLR